MKTSRENQNFVKIGQKCQAFYVRTQVRFFLPATLNRYKIVLFGRNGIILFVGPPVRPSVRSFVSSLALFRVQFDTGDFYQNVWTNYKFD
jgi:hypothetical protein